MPPGASASFTGTTIPVERLLRPYPQFDTVNNTTYDGYSWYHGLQVHLEKRFSKGFTVDLAFTQSKYMDATSYLNATSPLPVRGISSNDRPIRLTVSPLYELPFGKGKKFAQNGLIRHIAGGWQLDPAKILQQPEEYGSIVMPSGAGVLPLPPAAEMPPPPGAAVPAPQPAPVVRRTWQELVAPGRQ
jgi:hypothetical protein